MGHIVILNPSQSPSVDSDIDSTQKHDHHENDHESPKDHSDEHVLNFTIATIGNHCDDLCSLLDTFFATKLQAFHDEIRHLPNHLGLEYTPRQQAYLLKMYGDLMEQAANLAIQRLRYDLSRLEGLSGDTRSLSGSDEDEDEDEGEGHGKAGFSLPSLLLTSPSNSFYVQEALDGQSIKSGRPRSKHTEPSPSASSMLDMSFDSLLSSCAARKPSHDDQGEGDEQNSTAEETQEDNSPKQPRRKIVIDWVRFHSEYCDEGGDVADCAWCDGWREGFGQERPAIGRGTECFKELIDYLEAKYT